MEWGCKGSCLEAVNVSKLAQKTPIKLPNFLCSSSAGFVTQDWYLQTVSWEK
jgi:hypothetical protein